MGQLFKFNYNNIFIKVKVTEEDNQFETKIMVVRPTPIIDREMKEKSTWRIRRENKFMKDGEPEFTEESGFFTGDQPCNLKSHQYRNLIQELYLKAIP